MHEAVGRGGRLRRIPAGVPGAGRGGRQGAGIEVAEQVGTGNRGIKWVRMREGWGRPLPLSEAQESRGWIQTKPELWALLAAPSGLPAVFAGRPLRAGPALRATPRW